MIPCCYNTVLSGNVSELSDRERVKPYNRNVVFQASFMLIYGQNSYIYHLLLQDGFWRFLLEYAQKCAPEQNEVLLGKTYRCQNCTDLLHICYNHIASLSYPQYQQCHINNWISLLPLLFHLPRFVVALGKLLLVPSVQFRSVSISIRVL